MTERGYQALIAGHDPLWSEKLRDQKPTARVRADQNEWKRIRALKVDGQPCRLCPQPAVDPHHIIPKGMGGGQRYDVADNIAGLCRACHDLVTDNDPWACSLLGQRLTSPEREFVIGKKGAFWLEVRYGIKEEAA